MGARLGLLVLAMLPLGCGVGHGKGEVTGSVYLEQCETDTMLGSLGQPAAFDLKPSYFVADPINDDPAKVHPVNRVNIRVQSTGNRIEEADGVFVNIADVRLVALAIGQPLPLGPDTTVRATLNLLRTCPKTPTALELDGTITFSRFGSTPDGGAVSDKFSIGFGDPITATFDADLVDRRALTLGGVNGVPTTPQGGGHLAGNFDFEVQQGRAAQAYP